MKRLPLTVLVAVLLVGCTIIRSAGPCVVVTGGQPDKLVRIAVQMYQCDITQDASKPITTDVLREAGKAAQVSGIPGM